MARVRQIMFADYGEISDRATQVLRECVLPLTNTKMSGMFLINGEVVKNLLKQSERMENRECQGELERIAEVFKSMHAAQDGSVMIDIKD